MSIVRPCPFSVEYELCKFESVIDAQRTIKDFFKKVLGITEFDGRSWHKIILEEED